MQPSDSLPPSATAPVPLARGLPRCRRLFYAPGRADDTCARKRVVRRRRVTGAPRHRDWSRRGEGLPGYGTVLFVRAMVEHPARYTPLLAPKTFPQGDVGAFEYNRTLGIRKDERFRGRMPLARTFVCLRIACRVSTTGARLATGSGGLTLGRAGFAPAGRHTKFHGDIASSNSL